jgi:methionyl-tRNA formyltransferase
MRILLWGNGERGVRILDMLLKSSLEVAGAIGLGTGGKFTEAAKNCGLEVFTPEDPNSPNAHKKLRGFDADLFVLAGYGIILTYSTIALPPKGAINLHGGKLPEFRGSSPMNWALIRGEKNFSVSIIAIKPGVDTGDIVAETEFPISIDDTIADLHHNANSAFCIMLEKVLIDLDDGKLKKRQQDKRMAAYYPQRFPDDGLIFFDQISALDIHNKIRALTLPYPCAFTFYQGSLVKLISSRLTKSPIYGEPGRVYQVTEKNVLVCASDKCLWITAAELEDGQALHEVIPRYGRLATITEAAYKLLSGKEFSQAT